MTEVFYLKYSVFQCISVRLELVQSDWNWSSPAGIGPAFGWHWLASGFP